MQAPQMPALPLRDIKLPSEPGFWPLAPGWWILIVLLLLLASWLCIKWYRYTKKKKRWKTINLQLSQIEFDFQKTQNSQQLLTDVSVFLRRFVKHQLQQHQATSLSGDAWIDHLNQDQKNAPFNAFSEALSEGVYQTEYAYDESSLLNTVRRYMQQQVMQPKQENKDV